MRLAADRMNNAMKKCFPLIHTIARHLNNHNSQTNQFAWIIFIEINWNFAHDLSHFQKKKK